MPKKLEKSSEQNQNKIPTLLFSFFGVLFLLLLTQVNAIPWWLWGYLTLLILTFLVFLSHSAQAPRAAEGVLQIVFYVTFILFAIYFFAPPATHSFTPERLLVAIIHLVILIASFFTASDLTQRLRKKRPSLY